MTGDSTIQPPTTPAISATEARRAARNAGALAAASIVSKGMLFGWQLILARQLGPDEYGIYGTVGALFAVAAPVASFSMGMIVIRDVARSPERAGKYLSATLFVQTILSLLAYVGINLVAGVLGSEAIRGYVALAGLSILIDLYGNMCYDQMLAQERMIATSLVEVGHILLRVGLAGLALAAGFGLLGVYGATLLTGLGRAAVLWILLLRTGVRPQWPLDHELTRPLMVNSAPLALTAFIGLAYSHVDKLLSTPMIGITSTGYLTAAFVVIFGIVEMLSTTVLTATFPMMSRYSGAAMFGFMVEKLAFFTAVISLPLSLLLSLFAADITIPLFHEAYRPTAAVLAVLVWYALVTMIANVISQAMMVQNRQRRLLVIQSGGLLVNLTLNLILLPRIGVIGAALATVSAEILVLLVMATGFRADGWEWPRVLSRMGRLVLLGVIAALVMIALKPVHPLVGMVGGLGIYAAGILAGPILGADDWDLLYRLAAAIPGGAHLLKYWRRDVPINW